MVKLRIGQIYKWTSFTSNKSVQIELIGINTATTDHVVFKCIKSEIDFYAPGHTLFFSRYTMKNSKSVELIKDVGKYCVLCDNFYYNAENNVCKLKFCCWECEIIGVLNK